MLDNTPLAKFIDQCISGLTRFPGDPGEKYTKDEISTVSEAGDMFFEAWVGLERVFGDLEENRPHPNGWDKLTCILMSKILKGGEEPDTGHGCVGTDFLTTKE